MNEYELTNLIKVERARNDVTQEELAEALGISRTTVNEVETGKRKPTVITALRIAKYFGVNMEYLFIIKND